MKKRAQQQEETRLRIVEATIELHQEIGGLNTTVSAIADRAGVERATVYRHFPDERALLQGCTGHYLSQNPLPDPAVWRQIEAGEERLQTALHQIYAYHRRTEVMMARVVSDLPQMPVLQEVLAPMFAYWDQVRDLLVEPWQAVGKGTPALAAAIGHAIAFPTWQSLARGHGLDDKQTVCLMMGMVRAVVCNPRE